MTHDLNRYPRPQAIVAKTRGLSEDGGLDQLAGAIVSKGAHGVALRVFGQQLPSRRPVVGVRAPIAHVTMGEAIGGIVGVGDDARSIRHRGAVADGVVGVGEGLAGRVIGGGEFLSGQHLQL